MKIIKLDSRRSENDRKDTTNSKKLSYFVDSFHKTRRRKYVMRLERENDVGSLNRKQALKNIKKSNKPHLIKRGLHDGDN